jgi:hypothetical protein
MSRPHSYSMTRSSFLVLVGMCVALLLGGCTERSDEIEADSQNSGGARSATQTHRPAEAVIGELQLVDWTNQSGIDFVHTDGSAGKHYIMETVSCGLALLDYDRDGWIDIYFCNGTPIADEATARSDDVPHHALYRNLGGMRFRDVSGEAGINCQAFGLGIAVGDYNNDGFSDIYLSNADPNVLYRNNGDGTFTEVTETAGVGRGDRVGAGTCFLDVDADGDLDLFAANYVQFSEALHRAPRRRGRAVYPGPMDYPQETNSLFRNEGDGHWTEVSHESGIAAKGGTGMGTVCGDFDGDGDTDIYVANDEMANFLYQNDGKGLFDEQGIFAGAAFDTTGLAHGSMGAECGDFDNDGRLDLYVTAYQNEMATLYRNLGHGAFQDVTRLTRAGAGTPTTVTWGCGLVDLDNDGDRDLFIASGHLDDREENKVYHAPTIVLQNQLIETGSAKFMNISGRCGDGPLVKASSRGAVFGDLDNDGDMDAVVLNSRERPTVMKNLLTENGSEEHWLQISLRGDQANRDGVGARVIVQAGSLSLVDEVHSGRGYQSHWGTRLHFGLGHHDQVDRVEVHWLGGGVDILEDVRADQQIVVHESR